MVTKFGNYETYCQTAAFSADSSLVATGDQEGRALVRNAETGERLAVLAKHDSWVESLAFSPDGKRLVTGAYNGDVRIWNIQTGEHVELAEKHSDRANAVAFSPDGRSILSAGQDGVVYIRGPGRRLELRPGGPVWDAHVSPDGTRVFITGYLQSVQIWDAASGKRIASVRHQPGERINGIVLLPDGRGMLTCGLLTKGKECVGEPLSFYRRRRPEWWWGVFYLWEFWLTAAFGWLFIWSVVRDRRSLSAKPEPVE